MPSFRISPPRRRTGGQLALFASLFAGLSISSFPSLAPAQAGNAAPAGNQATTELKIESNLVVVRVVVRDAQGHPVEGLKKEDFKLFDRGKEQSIAQFEFEPTVEKPLPSAFAQAPAQTAREPERFIALYFDDLNSSDGVMMAARDAADRYLAANLRASDHVAIFTTGKILSDFTSDPKQLHTALFQLHSSGRNLTRVHECPDLTDYQAQQIVETDDSHSDVWMATLAEVVICAPPPDPRDTPASIRMLAQRILAMAQAQARENLEQLAKVVNVMTQAPGVRTVILVSPGFLSQSEQLALDRIVDRALRSQVVINSLDPKGLAVPMRENDVSQQALPNPKATQARHTLDAARELVTGDVLAEFAQGTGGEFVHNDNDLQAEFEKLAGHPAEYTLAFAPKELKLDGKFHALKVALAEKEKGYTIQARRGYFAVKEQSETSAEAAQPASPTEARPTAKPVAGPQPEAASPTAAQPKAANPEAQEQEQIQNALRSKTDSAGLPVGLEASPSGGEGETRALAVTVHLDVKTLRLRKDAGHSLDTLTFAIAVFDEKDNVVQVKQRRAKVDLLDDQLADFLDNGVEVNTMFEVKPGSYRLRAVVIESNEHSMAAFSRAVVVP